MKVKTLIELLQQTDPEKEVILSGDEEGNNFYIINSDSIDEGEQVIIYPFERKELREA
jgi:hypothetical protein